MFIVSMLLIILPCISLYIVLGNTHHTLELINLSTVKVTTYNRFFNKKEITEKIYKRVYRKLPRETTIWDWFSKDGEELGYRLKIKADKLFQAKFDEITSLKN